MKIAEVFRSTGQPTITYVPRESGHYEKKLNNYLDERGQLCLITGPSKTGKSTLYKRVLAERGQEPLVVQCTAERKCSEIWKEALAAINFENVKSIATTRTSKIAGVAEVATKFGWKWLGEVSGRISGTVGQDFTEAVARERILMEPSPDLLIPVLNKTNFVLVIEDFHYLSDGEKVLLFQQWKRFVDNDITSSFLALRIGQ